MKSKQFWMYKESACWSCSSVRRNVSLSSKNDLCSRIRDLHMNPCISGHPLGVIHMLFRLLLLFCRMFSPCRTVLSSDDAVHEILLSLDVRETAITTFDDIDFHSSVSSVFLTCLGSKRRDRYICSFATQDDPPQTADDVWISFVAYRCWFVVAKVSLISLRFRLYPISYAWEWWFHTTDVLQIRWSCGIGHCHKIFLVLNGGDGF